MDFAKIKKTTKRIEQNKKNKALRKEAEERALASREAEKRLPPLIKEAEKKIKAAARRGESSAVIYEFYKDSKERITEEVAKKLCWNFSGNGSISEINDEEGDANEYYGSRVVVKW